jgi:hypothetical protein
MASKD